MNIHHYIRRTLFGIFPITAAIAMITFTMHFDTLCLNMYLFFRKFCLFLYVCMGCVCMGLWGWVCVGGGWGCVVCVCVCVCVRNNYCLYYSATKGGIGQFEDIIDLKISYPSLAQNKNVWRN